MRRARRGTRTAGGSPLRALLRELKHKPALITWCLFVATLPFYVGRSGLPQPGNALLFVLVPLAITGWSGRLAPGLLRPFRALVWFTIWVCVVNYGWVVVTGTWSIRAYALMPLYYIFNTAVVFAALVLYERYGELFVRITLYGVLLDVAFQVVASFFYRTDLYRGELFFNNPNQLGYWALLAACLIALTQRRVGLSLLKASAGLSGCAYLAILSASRAAVGGIIILLVFLVFSNPRVIIGFSLAALGLVSLGGPLSDAIDSSEFRTMNRRDTESGFAAERGYTRIWEFKEYVLVGAGEGDNVRFVSDPRRANEIHSSLGTIIFSYGIVGTALFFVFFARMIRGSTRRAILMLLPILAYTMAHQGLRFTTSWVVLAVFLMLKPSARPKVIQPSPNPRPVAEELVGTTVVTSGAL
ncbi:MAG: hypothetical protein IPQ07_36255 [Myxococcales bacterium]|nr:hypothetical protein [Myxococcales bacterium]